MKKLLILTMLFSSSVLADHGNGKLTQEEYTNAFCEGYMSAVVETRTPNTADFSEAHDALDYFNTVEASNPVLHDDGGYDTISLDKAFKVGYNNFQSTPLTKALMPSKCLNKYGEYLKSLYMPK